MAFSGSGLVLGICVGTNHTVVNGDNDPRFGVGGVRSFGAILHTMPLLCVLTNFCPITFLDRSYWRRSPV